MSSCSGQVILWKQVKNNPKREDSALNYRCSGIFFHKALPVPMENDKLIKKLYFLRTSPVKEAAERQAATADSSEGRLYLATCDTSLPGLKTAVSKANFQE